jgi:hypothetical protein
MDEEVALSAFKDTKLAARRSLPEVSRSRIVVKRLRRGVVHVVSEVRR